MKSLSLQKLCPELSYEEIIKIARKTGFAKRVEKKSLPKNTCFIFVKNQ